MQCSHLPRPEQFVSARTRWSGRVQKHQAGQPAFEIQRHGMQRIEVSAPIAARSTASAPYERPNSLLDRIKEVTSNFINLEAWARGHASCPPLNAQPSKRLLDSLVNTKPSKRQSNGLERLTPRLPHCCGQPWRSPTPVRGFVQIAIPLIHPRMRAAGLPRLAGLGVVDHPRVVTQDMKTFAWVGEHRSISVREQL